MMIPDSRLPHPGRTWRLRHGVLTVAAAAGGSLLLLFLAAPVAELIVTGGAGGLVRLGRDAELRGSLALTAMTATAATIVGVACGTPIAYLLSRSGFRGRAVLSALLDLFLLQKTLYEISYEAANRPSWLSVPVRGMLDLLGRAETRA